MQHITTWWQADNINRIISKFDVHPYVTPSLLIITLKTKFIMQQGKVIFVMA